nr:MAG TPA: hypothetical protein [Caudoviricetes sp.]
MLSIYIRATSTSSCSYVALILSIKLVFSMLERSLLSSFCSLEFLVVEMNLNLIWSSVYLCIFSVTINYISLKCIDISVVHIKIISS